MNSLSDKQDHPLAADQTHTRPAEVDLSTDFSMLPKTISRSLE